MTKARSARGRLAVMLLSTALLAVTPAFAQTIARSAEEPKSILSLAPSPKPQAYQLARRAGDSTFANAPANYHVFSAATVGENTSVELLTINFAGATQLTTIQSKNKDFVVEGGTCHEGNSYAKGDSCSMLVRFNPQGPGHRLGFVTIAHTASVAPMYVGLTGNGYAPVVSFIPSFINTIPTSVSSGTGTISGATSMAIDGGDILYIADTGNDKLKEMDSSGVITPTALGPIATPASLAADSFGIVYTANTHGSSYYFSIFYPWGTQTAYGYGYTSSTCTPTAPCAFSAVGMNYPANMSIDNSDNLIFEEGTTGTAEMPVTNVSGGSATLNLWHLSDQFSYSSGTPASFAVDANGDLYTVYHFGSATCYIIEEPLYNAEYSPTANRVAGGTNCGFSGDGGQARGAEISTTIGQMTFDAAGNLYFADAGNQRVRRIDATTGIIHTIAGDGVKGYTGDGGTSTLAELANPAGVAVDSNGQVYILQNAPAAGPTQVVRVVGTTGRLSYGGVLKGTSSTALVVVVSNTGNSDLVLSSAPIVNGTNHADFAIDSNTTTCALTPGATLASGQSCKIGAIFKPQAAGIRSATLVLPDNTVTGQNLIALVGIGNLPAPTMSITSPGTSASTGTTITFSASVTSTSSTKPTGTVTFSVNGTNIHSPVTLSSGSASTTFSETTAAKYTLKAVYSGDSNYATASVSESVTFTAPAIVKAPTQLILSPAFSPASSICGQLSFSVQASSKSGGSPTGTVALVSSESLLSSASLNNGSATLSTRGLPPGVHSFTASYKGDSLHQPATSAAVQVAVPVGGTTCNNGLGVIATSAPARENR